MLVILKQFFSTKAKSEQLQAHHLKNHFYEDPPPDFKSVKE